MITIQLHQGGVATLCDPILRSVPEWFGIESANQHYLKYVDEHPVFVAYDDGQARGFLALEQHFPLSAEIHVMIVHRDYHRQGIGRKLIDATEAQLRSEGVRFLQVKTLADSHPDKGYRLTRAFYRSAGFVPLEVFPELWGKENPALQLIKAL